jgi:hypothetical protein
MSRIKEYLIIEGREREVECIVHLVVVFVATTSPTFSLRGKTKITKAKDKKIQ